MEGKLIAIIFDSKMRVKAWYVNPSLKFFKLDGKFRVDINGDDIYTLNIDENVTFDLRGMVNLTLVEVKPNLYDMASFSEWDLQKQVKDFVE